MQKFKLLTKSNLNKGDGGRFPNKNYRQNKGFSSKQLTAPATKVLGKFLSPLKIQVLKLLMLEVTQYAILPLFTA